MVASSMRVLLVAVVAGAGLVSQTRGHPIGDVIALLENLKVEAKTEGESEAAIFQKFTYWCKSSDKSLSKDIQKEKTTIGELKDKIDGLKADIVSLTASISTLANDLTEMNNAATKAKKKRDDELALYKDEQSNFDDTIGAVDDATATLKDSASLLQRPPRAHAFLQVTQPEEAAYASKTGGIIETFKGMSSEFEAEKLDSTQAETNKANAYKLAKQGRDTAIKAAQDSKSEQEGIKGDKESELADAETALTQETSKLAGDSTLLDDTRAQCTAKTEEWNQRSAVRAGELKAMDMAIKILGKATGVRNPDTHEIPAKSALFSISTRVWQDTSNFRMAVSLLQLSDPKARAVNLLRQAAKAGHSRSLQRLAQEIMTYEGPFDKIKQMMQKMIFQLMAEQKDEDDHKDWCDLETEKNTEAKADKSAKIGEMTSKVSEMKAKIQTLSGEISDNEAKVETLTSHMKEETELRNENHEEILATIKDSQDAQQAVTAATSVLKEFYKSSGQVPKEPWEFLQLPDAPDTWDSSYTGAADPQNPQDGILAILDGVNTKFSTMEADAKAQDSTDQKNFEEDMAASKVELATTRQDSEMKTSRKASLTEKMQAMQGQLKSATDEKAAVAQYLKDLEPACGAGDSNYADRKQARADEITALRRAQGILEEAFRAK